VIIKIAQIVFVALVILMSGVAGSQETSTSEPPQAVNAATPQAQTPASAQDVALGEPLEWSLPKYPKQARKLNLQGDVGLILHVNEKGKVKEVSALSGDPGLIKAATDAAKKWSYLPYDVNGSAVPVTTKVLVRFGASQAKPDDVSVVFEMPKLPPLEPIYKGGPGITGPIPVDTPDPDYSNQTKHLPSGVRCELAIVIGPDGRTYDIKVLSSVNPEFDAKAIETVRRWRFEPARKDGKPVSFSTNVGISFTRY